MSSSDFNFDSSDGESSDFSGFESDDLPLADFLSDPSSSDDDDDEIAPVHHEWTARFTPPTVCNLF